MIDSLELLWFCLKNIRFFFKQVFRNNTIHKLFSRLRHPIRARHVLPQDNNDTTTAAQDEGEWRRTVEQGAEHFMAKLIVAEKTN